MKLILAQHYWQHTIINILCLAHAVLRLIYINLLNLYLCIIQLYLLFIKTTNTKLTKYVWYNNLINVSSLFQIQVVINKFSNVMLQIIKLYKAHLIYILIYLLKQQLHICLWCCQILITLIIKQYITIAIIQYMVVLYTRIIYGRQILVFLVK